MPPVSMNQINKCCMMILTKKKKVLFHLTEGVVKKAVNN